MNYLNELELLNKIRNKIKDSDVIKDLCKKYKVDLDYLDLIPMCFEDLDVSARTEKGILYFNTSLLKKPEEIDHYMVHEITHHFDQCHSDKPTQGSLDDKDYLANIHEQKGFKAQTKYLSETKGDEAAESYINKVLDYHDTPAKEVKTRKKQLLQLASLIKLK